MALNFQPYPNQRPSASEDVDRWGQQLNRLGDTFAQNSQMRQQRERQAMLDNYLRQEYANKQIQNDYTYGVPIDPNEMAVQPTGQMGMSRFMPGGQGQVATGSPLIQEFETYRSKNYPTALRRPEFESALSGDERKMIFERDNPKPVSMFMTPYQQASLDLKGKEIDLKKTAQESKDETQKTKLDTTLELYETARKGLME